MRSVISSSCGRFLMAKKEPSRPARNAHAPPALLPLPPRSLPPPASLPSVLPPAIPPATVSGAAAGDEASTASTATSPPFL